MRRLGIAATLCLVTLQACGSEGGEGAPGDRPENALDESGVTTTATVVEYAMGFHFLAADPAQNSALVFEFSNTATAGGLAHRYLGWQLGPGGWRSAFDIQFDAPPTRAPWRLFPVQGLQLTVSDDGDPDDIILQTASSESTLDLGPLLDSWEDRSGTSHEVREATWVVPSGRIAGLALGHRLAVPEPPRPARFGSFFRAILRSQGDAFLVLFYTTDPDRHGNPFAWMFADGLTRRWTVLETRVLERASARELGRDVPARVSFAIPEAGIRGELTVQERRYEELPGSEAPKPYNALCRVRGWMEFAGERRSLDGILEVAES